MRASFLSRIRLPCQETVNLLGESSARSGAGGFAQCAVVFKVGLVEPLVSGGVVREVAINEGIAENVTGIAGDNSRLYVQQDTVCCIPAGPIVNLAEGKMRRRKTSLREGLRRLERGGVDFNFDSEIGTASLHGVVEVAEGEARTEKRSPRREPGCRATTPSAHQTAS